MQDTFLMRSENKEKETRDDFHWAVSVEGD